MVYQGYEPIDVEIDQYNNLYFLDRGAKMIGVSCGEIMERDRE